MRHNNNGGLLQVTFDEKAVISNLGAFGAEHGVRVGRLLDLFFALLQKETHLSEL